MGQRVQNFFRVNSVDILSDVFHLGLVWRIVYGVFKVFVGFVLLHFHGMAFFDVFHHFTAHELFEDRSDPLIHLIEPVLLRSSLTVTYFLAAYIMFWGALDAFFSFWLLRGKVWAYPLASTLMALFIVYQTFRFTHTHSAILLFFTLIDVSILALTIREYRKKVLHL